MIENSRLQSYSLSRTTVLRSQDTKGSGVHNEGDHIMSPFSLIAFYRRSVGYGEAQKRATELKTKREVLTPKRGYGFTGNLLSG